MSDTAPWWSIDGSFSYTHDGRTTSDSFTYKANDGLVDSNSHWRVPVTEVGVCFGSPGRSLHGG